MPNGCVAIGCGNMPSDSVSFIRFPKDPNLCGFWTRQVQPHAGALEVTTSVEAFLDHFSVNCFDEIPALKAIIIYALLYNVTVC